ncbi:MAG: Ig-like domain-containing protein, partial [Candidatus Gastranaerophilales bacterium]|nr:Ig-like domain-containing protein [Candidatus Gastranaerophilales bacterium]
MASAKSKQNDADSINVSSEAMNLYAGQKRTLTARTGRLGKVTAGVIWKSSNEKVSKVNKKGEVKAVKKGKAVITDVSKTNNKHKAKCRIKVREFKEKSCVVNKGEGVCFPLIYDDSNRISSFSVLKIHNKKEWDNFLDKYMKDDELKDIKNRYKKSFFEKNGILVYAASLRVYSDVSSVGFEYSIIQKDDGKINLSVG